MYLNLNNCKWKVKGYWPHVPIINKSAELGIELMGVTEWIDATVPGGVHNDLLKAGIIEDPYFEVNSIKCEWVENRWWQYKTKFFLDSSFRNKKLSLIFKGVDYKAGFYLNDKILGEHEGMYEPVIFDVTELIKLDSENELMVLLHNVPFEMNQIGYTSRTKTQKSRFNYKWDFSTHLINIGLWDDVLLEANGEFTLNDTHIESDYEAGNGIISVSSRIEGKAGETCLIKISIDYMDERICCWEETMESDESIFNISKRLEISNPKLWYTNGNGEQCLYYVQIQVIHNDLISDSEEYFIGIRKLEYRMNEDSPADALQYTFVVNGMPIYIKGVNLLPFDHLYGNVTRDIYDKYIQWIKLANINMVRIWGGGIIEKEYFYHLCDRNGIMVWQEFIQSSSGIDNIPSLDSHFLELLKATAVSAVKIKRNHVSLTVWCGGNELCDKNTIPVTYSDPNIGMLKAIVDEYDHEKLFLPTSPSGPHGMLKPEWLGENYDSHGSWVFEGVENHYKLYNSSDCLFHSEFGVGGMSACASLEKFMGKNHLKVTNMGEDLVWRHHGESWDTYFRDKEIFGEFLSLEQFIKCSQFIQAEGLRYIIESNCRRMFRNSGSIIWQLNEPWPNVSNSCILDFYCTPKMAYYLVKDAFSPVHASLRYNKLFYKPEEDFEGIIYLNNSQEEQELTVLAEILDVTGKIIHREEFKKKLLANSAVEAGRIKMKLPEQESEVFFVRLNIKEVQESLDNLYVFSQREKEIFSPLLKLEKGKLKIHKTEDGYIIKNIGRKVCLFINGKQINKDTFTVFRDNYITLFPNEERLLSVLAFKTENNPNNTEIKWDCFNGIDRE